MMHTYRRGCDSRNAWLTAQHASGMCKCPSRSPKCRPGAGFRSPPHRFYVCKEWHHATVPLKARNLSKRITAKNTTRNLTMLGLFAAPWVGFLAVALKPSPRQLWAQRWPTITFVGLYQLALDRCVEIFGLEHLPRAGPVILAGNHINKTAADAMLMGSKILVERGSLAKFVSQPNPPDRM